MTSELTAALLVRRLPCKVTLTIAVVIDVICIDTLGWIGSTSIQLIIVYGWIFNFAVGIYNTTIWVFTSENYPTRIRSFGTAFIITVGFLLDYFFPIIGGRMFDAYGLPSLLAFLLSLL